MSVRSHEEKPLPFTCGTVQQSFNWRFHASDPPEGRGDVKAAVRLPTARLASETHWLRAGTEYIGKTPLL